MPPPSATPNFHFDQLVDAVLHTHEDLAQRAARAVNQSLTLRNWLIGAYISAYELRGADRATYGERVIESLAERLKGSGLPRLDTRELRRFRQFYLAYPQIRETLSPESTPLLVEHIDLATTPQIGETLSPTFMLSGQRLLQHLSFSHFVELIKLNDALARSFYEVECIQGGWSVRELKRQIASLYFERSGLSTRPELLSANVQAQAEAQSLSLTVRDPYVFEFLGLQSKEVMAESDLEAALIEHVQDFMLELGHGFCFEARQKRILIGETHYFVDLVFYHRVLKCHVLIELKVDGFQHEHLGQLNTYVSWYATNEMTEGDNPPIGLLLCTQKDHALVEYALAAMKHPLFVSKYALVLPSREQLTAFLSDKIKESRC